MNSRGFSAIDMMLACALATVSGVALMSFGQLVNDFSRKSTVKSGAMDVRTEIIMIAMDSKAWGVNISKAGTADAGSTVVYNPEMTCLKDKTNCNEGEYALTLFDGTGRVYIDAQNPHQGFTSKGAQCFTFGAENGGEGDCVLRYSMKWEAVCPPLQTSCSNPQVHLKLNLATSTQQQMTFMNMRTAQMAMDMFAVDPTMPVPPIPTPTPTPPPGPTPTPTPGNIVTYTNSTLYSSKNTISIDLSAALSDATGATFSLPSTASDKNGKVTLAGATATYTPATGYYGHDSFNFTATDSTGKTQLLTAKVEVMTPHTWTGGAGTNDASNTKNWCGEVQSGKCDNSSFGSGFLDANAHVVFDSTCSSNCDATFSQSAITIKRYEQMSTYKNTVTMNCSTLTVNGTNIETESELDIEGGVFNLSSSCQANVNGCAHIGAGIISADFAKLNVITDRNNTASAPAAGSCTGIKIEAAAAQLPSFSSSGTSITLQASNDKNKPEVYFDPSLSLKNFSSTCTNSSRTAICEAYMTSSPSSTDTTNNGNMNASAFNDKCKSFLGSGSALVLNATNNIVSNGFAGTYTVTSANHFSISSGAGSLFVKSALVVDKLAGLAGDIMVNAGTITQATGMATNRACLKAATIGDLASAAGDLWAVAESVNSLSGGAGTMVLKTNTIGSVTGVAGEMYLKATSIGPITNIAGDLHIYGAHVTSISQGAGTIYLHDGATVDSITNFAGPVKTNASGSWPY